MEKGSLFKCWSLDASHRCTPSANDRKNTTARMDKTLRAFIELRETEFASEKRICKCVTISPINSHAQSDGETMPRSPIHKPLAVCDRIGLSHPTSITHTTSPYTHTHPHTMHDSVEIKRIYYYKLFVWFKSKLHAQTNHLLYASSWVISHQIWVRLSNNCLQCGTSHPVDSDPTNLKLYDFL